MNNILIIGIGSVGTLIGTTLIKAGLNVTFAGKAQSKRLSMAKKQGLKIFYQNGESFWLSPVDERVCFTDTETYLPQQFPLIIVALKSNDLQKVSSYIKYHSTKSTIIVHAQNGIPYWWFEDEKYLDSLDKNVSLNFREQPYLNSVDNRGTILKKLRDRTLVGCVIKAPCHKMSDGSVKVSKPPRIILGMAKSSSDAKTQAAVKKLCQIFSINGVSANYTDNIRVAVCRKLAINVTTNVLSALTGKIVADLTSNYYTNNLIKTIIKEVSIIFQTYGLEARDLPTESQVYDYIREPGSQNHLPSLAQDFLQHRQGEISLITALVEMAKIANIQVPTLSSLAELLQLGQQYTINTDKEKCHILTFDRSTGCCLLNENAYQSNLFGKLHIPKLLNHLVKINVAALSY